ncbi:MAG: hypothetical protein GY839_03095 [candidate division Zixibacteria bacterium]|nr:hypothetical protein [candidate division Zixibacteria bacterium]
MKTAAGIETEKKLKQITETDGFRMKKQQFNHKDYDSRKDRKESFTDILPSWITNVLHLRTYFNMRKRIRGGEPLWELSGVQVRQQGLLGPWAFNLYESILATFPASIIIVVAKYFGESGLTNIFDFESPSFNFLEDQTATIAQDIFNSVWTYITPICLPLSILILGLIAGWAALMKSDRTFESQRKLTKVYLYIDGAYGLYHQAMVVLMLSVSPYLQEPKPTIWFVLAFMLAISAVPSLIYVLYLISVVIPKRLFKIIGYALVVEPVCMSFSSARKAPWYKYSLSVSVLAWVIIFLVVSALYVVSFIIAVSTASFFTWIT